MLLDILKGDIISAMRRGDGVAKDVLRLVVGEAQTLAASKGMANKVLTDDHVFSIIKEIVAKNQQAISPTSADGKVHEIPAEKKAVLEKENQLLQSYLPKQLTREEIKSRLLSIDLEIKSAKADGQAVGYAMKFLKDSGDSVDGSEVKAVVSEIRTLAQS